MLSDAQLLLMLLAPGSIAEEAQAVLDGLANLLTVPHLHLPVAVAHEAWHLRRGPSLDAPVVGAVEAGVLQEQQGQVGEWWLVCDVTRQQAGWVHEKAFE